MLIDNYSPPFVVTMTSDTTRGNLDPGKTVGIVRNMSMGLRTPVPQPMWPAKVSHQVPVEWLGNLHDEKQVQDPGEGYCGCSGEVKDRKQAAVGFLSWLLMY